MYFAKMTSWVTFVIVNNIIFYFRRLLSLLTEAAQMIQNKKKSKLWVFWAASSSYELPPCGSIANSCKDFPAS
jgi:hypothetical protein